ncbi:MAG: hypothetical protein JWM60_1465 [Solirubrobacterales bacterium]|nr:hypothetical protein [Solirubrobacterales bacterium]
MSLPPFLSRVHNAAGPLLGGIAESALAEVLRETTLTLEIDDREAADRGHRASFLFAVNLGARLYPRLSIAAPPELATAAAELARAINAGCELGAATGRTLTLTWCGGEPTADRVTVAADAWNVRVDHGEPSAGPAEPPAAMAAAALGIGALFRSLFAPHVAHPRTAAEPFALNLVTLGPPAETPETPAQVELGVVHLAGCGAVGQSAAAVLAQLPVRGTLVAVDHDPLDEGNLQRYLLALAADVGAAKPALIARAFEDHELEVVPVPTRWGEDEHTAPGRETVLSALDSKQGRIELQAGLPRELFNAWTQPVDVGVSRHQRFGEDPCLACLAWPRHARPNETKLIADALGEHELRVGIYAMLGVPVGAPLPADQIKGSLRLDVPSDAGAWAERSLLDDLVAHRGLPGEPFAAFKGVGIRALYRDVVCAGMLIEHVGARDPEVSVPLAHQSALAGVLLATWLFVDRVPALRELRPAAAQARYNVLRGGGEQIWPRERGRQARCLCSDPDFRDAYAARWTLPTASAA